jgi:hypothetical protein
MRRGHPGRKEDTKWRWSDGDRGGRFKKGVLEVHLPKAQEGSNGVSRRRGEEF